MSKAGFDVALNAPVIILAARACVDSSCRIRCTFVRSHAFG